MESSPLIRPQFRETDDVTASSGTVDSFYSYSNDSSMNAEITTPVNYVSPIGSPTSELPDLVPSSGNHSDLVPASGGHSDLAPSSGGHSDPMPSSGGHSDPGHLPAHSPSFECSTSRELASAEGSSSAHCPYLDEAEWKRAGLSAASPTGLDQGETSSAKVGSGRISSLADRYSDLYDQLRHLEDGDDVASDDSLSTLSGLESAQEAEVISLCKRVSRDVDAMNQKLCELSLGAETERVNPDSTAEESQEFVREVEKAGCPLNEESLETKGREAKVPVTELFKSLPPPPRRQVIYRRVYIFHITKSSSSLKGSNLCPPQQSADVDPSLQRPGNLNNTSIPDPEESGAEQYPVRAAPNKTTAVKDIPSHHGTFFKQLSPTVSEFSSQYEDLVLENISISSSCVKIGQSSFTEKRSTVEKICSTDQALETDSCDPSAVKLSSTTRTSVSQFPVPSWSCSTIPLCSPEDVTSSLDVTYVLNQPQTQISQNPPESKLSSLHQGGSSSEGEEETQSTTCSQTLLRQDLDKCREVRFLSDSEVEENTLTSLSERKISSGHAPSSFNQTSQIPDSSKDDEIEAGAASLMKDSIVSGSNVGKRTTTISATTLQADKGCVRPAAESTRLDSTKDDEIEAGAASLMKASTVSQQNRITTISATTLQADKGCERPDAESTRLDSGPGDQTALVKVQIENPGFDRPKRWRQSAWHLYNRGSRAPSLVCNSPPTCGQRPAEAAPPQDFIRASCARATWSGSVSAGRKIATRGKKKLMPRLFCTRANSTHSTIYCPPPSTSAPSPTRPPAHEDPTVQPSKTTKKLKVSEELETAAKPAKTHDGLGQWKTLARLSLSKKLFRRGNPKSTSSHCSASPVGPTAGGTADVGVTAQLSDTDYTTGASDISSRLSSGYSVSETFTSSESSAVANMKRMKRSARWRDTLFALHDSDLNKTLPELQAEKGTDSLPSVETGIARHVTNFLQQDRHSDIHQNDSSRFRKKMTMMANMCLIRADPARDGVKLTKTNESRFPLVRDILWIHTL